VLAGADIGVGVLLLVAAVRSEHDRQHDLVAYFTPRWEVHGVLLVFFSTGLFAAFPRALAEFGSALIAPVLGALVLLVVRSVAYIVLHADRARTRRTAATLFGAASTGVAGLLGAAAAAPAAGAVRNGVLVAATALAAYSRRRLPPTGWFERAAAATGLTALPAGSLAVAAIAHHDPRLHDRLLGHYGLVIAIGGALILAGIALTAHRPLPALAVTATGYASVLVGGAFAVYPYVVYPTLTAAAAAAPPASVSAFLAGTAVGGPIVLAALAALQIGTFRRRAAPSKP
jgi:cytochrome d ubiquinol oxidase subunit II